jgi:hypothetical protein
MKEEAGPIARQSCRVDRRKATVGLMLACALALVASLAAQDDGIAVNVGISAAKQGESIDIPVTLSAPDNSKIVAIHSEISYPKKMLSFTKADRGLAAEISDAEVSAKIKDNGDANTSVIELSAAGAKPIKPGILAYLTFTVSDTAAKGEVPLKMLSTKASSAAGEPVELAKGKDGEITVFLKDEEIPAVGCFFFTH